MKKAKSPSCIRQKENQPLCNYTFYQCKPQAISNQPKTVFYNQLMQQQRNHSKVESSKFQHRRNRPLSNSQQILVAQESMNKILVSQNQLLLNELLNAQLREAKYKEKIRQLKMKKMSRNYPDLTLRQENHCKNIAILDKQLQNSQNSPQKQSSRIYVSARTMQTQQDQSTLRNSLLNDSVQYIKHSQTAIQNQIDQLNDKLCRLLQSTSCEQNKEEKFRQRVEMSQCIRELKQLRKCYESIKS